MTAVQEKTLSLIARLTTLTQDGMLHWEADPMHQSTLRARLSERQQFVLQHVSGVVSASLHGSNGGCIMRVDLSGRGHDAWASDAVLLLYRVATDEAKDTAGSLDDALAALGEL